MQAVTDGKLADTEVKFCDKSACCVIMASKGYPLKYEKGFDIDIPADIKPYVYVAGAVKKDGRLLTSGGRVLGVTATADTLSDAVKTAYERVEKISFKNSYYRKDIGKKALSALAEDKSWFTEFMWKRSPLLPTRRARFWKNYSRFYP